jgi:hypothetical protein
VPSIEVANGRVAVIQGADGRIPLLEGLTRIEKPSRESRAPAAQTQPWKVLVETVKARDVQVELADRRSCAQRSATSRPIGKRRCVEAALRVA